MSDKLCHKCNLYTLVCRSVIPTVRGGLCFVLLFQGKNRDRKHYHGVNGDPARGGGAKPQKCSALGKPRGTYITAELDALARREPGSFAAAAWTIGRALRELLGPCRQALVVGLGNRTVTPDTLGPSAADMVLATRHIGGEFARAAGLTDLRPVAVLTPGVLGQTGAESSEIVHGVCRELSPAAVIAIDALAACSISRLGCTVQLSDTGIAPGSGVGNDRRPLDHVRLGVPVVAIGVPTVVDAATLIRELSPAAVPAAQNAAAAMMVTPREVDLMIARAARLIAACINAALQPDYPPLQLAAIARGL